VDERECATSTERNNFLFYYYRRSHVNLRYGTRKNSDILVVHFRHEHPPARNAINEITGVVFHARVG